ncbi:MAG: Lrp/AsnC family transcriptional regulator [Oligoflexia bacterium]|nr:Lrp/AsnC family transcriptional regulator [Oligoflexia bacterium]
MDQIEQRILWAIDRNCRESHTRIAESLGITKQRLHYRLQRLQQCGLVKRYIPLIDMHRLGFLTFRIYFRYKNLERFRSSEIVRHFERLDHTVWIGSLEGVWDLEVVFAVRSFVQLNNIFKQARATLGSFFQRYNISMSPVCYQFNRNYLVNRRQPGIAPAYYGFEPSPAKLGRNDLRVLAALAQDCRQTNRDLALRLGIAFRTVRQSIDRLEQLKIIQGYRAVFDVEKLGRRYYKALIKLTEMNEEIEPRLYKFCGKFNSVTYLTEVLGDWQLEIDVEVADLRDFTKLLSLLRQEFPLNVIDYEILEVVKEEKIDFFPMAASALKDFDRQLSQINE